jgi:hypothetical protein
LGGFWAVFEQNQAKTPSGEIIFPTGKVVFPAGKAIFPKVFAAITKVLPQSGGGHEGWATRVAFAAKWRVEAVD